MNEVRGKAMVCKVSIYSGNRDISIINRDISNTGINVNFARLEIEISLLPE